MSLLESVVRYGIFFELMNWFGRQILVINDHELYKNQLNNLLFLELMV